MPMASSGQEIWLSRKTIGIASCPDIREGIPLAEVCSLWGVSWWRTVEWRVCQLSNLYMQPISQLDANVCYTREVDSLE